MKICGEFILREVVGEYVLVPVGDTALEFNGVVSLNEVGACVWKQLQAGRNKADMVKRVLEEFEVSEAEAESDIDEFLQRLEESHLISEL